MLNINKTKMKTLITLFIVAIATFSVFAQTPNTIKYQTVVRDANGNAMVSVNVDFQISILETTASGSSIYAETFSTTTNPFGLVNLEIGNGTLVSGDFATIDWANDIHFVKIEVNLFDGNGLQEMGTSQLLSVPYALNAKSAENVFSGDYNDLANQPTIPANTSDLTNNSGFITSPDDADADSTNEIQDLNLTGNTLTITNNTSATNIDLSGYSNLWQETGNNIYYNNGYVGVGVNNPDGKLIIQGDASIDPDSAIFEVKNKDGKTVFAVYEEGVRVYVDDNGTKANSSKGGFAVGGFSAVKGLTNEYLRVTPDSIRAYIESEANSSKGGFAIGGFSATKVIPDIVFNVGASDSTDVIFPSKARMAWYPQKEAFLAGRIVVESADSVGLNSFATGFESKALGDYSQAFGYRARAVGDNSTAVGYYANAESPNSYAFGNYSLALDSGSYAIGTGAKASGLRSFALGSSGVDSLGVAISPTMATGEYSYAFGMGSIASNKYSVAFGTLNSASGEYSFAIGINTAANGNSSTSMGYGTIANASYSTAMGYNTIANGSASSAIGHSTTANGNSSTAMGYGTTANGSGSTAMGFISNANASYSTAMGVGTIANGQYSVVAGQGARTEGTFSIAMGEGVIARSYKETVFGSYNDTTTTPNCQWSWFNQNPVFVIGNGLNWYTRHNAFVILKNGNVGINTNTPDKLLTVQGDARVTGNIYYGAIGSFTIYSKPDFVFSPNYNQDFDIDYVENFINENGHLPWVTAAKDEKDGINMTRMGFETLEAVENQQLQIINLRKENLKIKLKSDSQQEIINKQQTTINQLIKRIEKLERALLKK